MRNTTAIAAAALCVWSLAGSAARGDWVGDIIYCANARGMPTSGNIYAWSVAAAYSDFAWGFIGGGRPWDDVAFGYSEPLGQNEFNWEDRDVVFNARAVVKYDDDTALMLCALRWGTGSNNVWLTQLEYRQDQDYEDDGGPGALDISNSLLDATGGMLSGRLQLAVAPEGGYDELAGYSGTRLRLSALEAGGLVQSDNVWDMTVDEAGNLYICGRTGGVGLPWGSVWKVPKTDATPSLGPGAGQRVGDPNVFGAPVQIISKQTGTSWFTGIAVDSGHLFVVDRAWGWLDVYTTSGTWVLSSDLLTLLGVTPEAVRVDPTYAGPGPGSC